MEVGLEGTWSDPKAYVEPLGRKLFIGDLKEIPQMSGERRQMKRD